jgi:hypothetical protein
MEKNNMEDVKKFDRDTWFFFDRTQFNLKGYSYKTSSCFVELLEKDMPRLKKALGKDIFDNARDISNEFDCSTIIFAQDEVFGDE